MIREAVSGDEALIEGYLSKHFTTCMFMRGNLRDFGIGNTKARYGTRFFIREENGVISGIGGIGNGGALMLQAESDLGGLVAYMRSAVPKGFVAKVTTGTPVMVAAIIAGFGLEDAPTLADDVEPLFLLHKSDLKRQDLGGCHLRSTTMNDLPILAEWNHAYGLEVLGSDNSDAARSNSRLAAEETIVRGHQQVLVKDGLLVAQTAFNAILPDAVQIGGVFTPPEQRGHGFARLAVAAHLDQAFAQGVENAVLFSASETASKVYRAIGFAKIGEFRLVLFGDRV